MEYKKTIGLEIHAQINTKTKLFSRALVDENADPNSQVDYLDAGLPGTLPVPNEKAIFMALKTSLALDMQINQVSIFDRKHYFYQDSPLGYQITQFYKPIGLNGFLEVNNKKFRINRLHIESDAGKSIYKDGKTYVDLNRAQVPLMEIVTEPDFDNEDDVVAFLKELRSILMTIETCKCNLEQGNFRVDVNFSIHKENEPFGTRVEIKNLNSFSNIRKAIQYEYNLQMKTIEAGGVIKQETKLFDTINFTTKSMRDKEEFYEYSYFKDPDLLPIYISDEKLKETAENMPKLPASIRNEYMEKGVSKELCYTITETLLRMKFFANLVEKIGVEKIIKIANWFCSELIGKLDDFDEFIEKRPDFEEKFAKIIILFEEEKITRANAKELLDIILESNDDIDKIIKNKGYLEKLDIDLDALIVNFIEKSPEEVEKFKKGKVQIVMFFVGEIMKQTRGKANPDLIKEKVLFYLNKVIG